ncbi:MAG: Zn-dependent alcohol dehydrogenase [Deltaproteobacteria bacterium]|nr:Zn-dependent alcohol dehydrogenase [Deltaproteobacteria bacterium]
MRAAVCYEYGKPLVVEEIDIDPPMKGEVKVRLAATSVCHSDVSIIRGLWGGSLPVLAGHEAAGIVEDAGEDVTLARPGDTVVVSLLRSCGRCFYCVAGFPYACEAEFALDSESRLRNKKGEFIHRGLRTAAFAEYVIVHQSQVAKIPDEMPMDRAALLPCAVITGVGAVVNTAKVRPGDSVVVIGTGGVGLNSVQGALLAGAHVIIAVDILDTKLRSARSFGATHTVNARDNDAVKAVKEMTSGRGAAFVFVTVGSSEAARQAFEMTGKRGTVIIIGQPEIDATVSFSIDSMIKGERRVMGSPMGSGRLSLDIPWLVSLYQQGRLKLDELITERYPLEKINEAIESLERGNALRNVILF